MHLNPTYFVIG